MLRSIRHTAILSALILSLIAAPAAIAGPSHGIDLDVRASIQAFFSGLVDIFEGLYGTTGLSAESEQPWSVTIQKSVPSIPVNGDTETNAASSEEEDPVSTPPEMTESGIPSIPVNG